MTEYEKQYILDTASYFAGRIFELNGQARLDCWRRLSNLEEFLQQDNVTFEEADKKCDEFEREFMNDLLIQKLAT